MPPHVSEAASSREVMPVDPDVLTELAPAVETTRPSAPPVPLDVLAAIALGGGIGSVSRYLLGQAFPTAAGGFPWATFAINAVGCLCLGVLMVLVLEIWRPTRLVRPFLGVGVLGGFTTFSTYTVEVRGLLAHGQYALALAYAAGSLVVGFAAVWAAVSATRSLAARGSEEATA